MAQATDAQVQRYSDERLRPRAEQLIRLLNALTDDRGAIDAVYDRLVNGAAWADARTDGPPVLMAGSHVLAYNTFAADLVTFIEAHNAWPVVRSASVTGLSV